MANPDCPTECKEIEEMCKHERKDAMLFYLREAEMNLEMARLTAPEVRLAGVAMNTSALNEEAARDLLAETAEELGIPAVDPVRTGVAAIVSALEEL